MGKLGCLGKSLAANLATGLASEAAGWFVGHKLSQALYAGAEEAAAGSAPNELKPASGLTHHIKHSSFWAALAGAIVGALVSAALTFLVMGLIGVTGGLGALVIGVGVGMGFGSLISGAASGVTNLINSMLPANDGPIIMGSPLVLVGGLPAARATLDPVGCIKHQSPQLIAQGSETVYIDGFPAARKDDKVVCGAPLAQGVEDVLFGGPQGTYLEIENELSLFERGLILVAECVIPPFSGLANASRKIGSKIGSKAGNLATKVAPKLMNALKKGPQLLNKAGAALSQKMGKLGQAMGFGSCNAGSSADGPTSRKNTGDGDGQSTCNKSACASDPIDTSTGAVVDEQIDFTIGSSFPFALKRSYNSQRRARGLLGQGWRCTLDEHLELSFEGEHVEFCSWDGAVVPFDLTPGSRRVFNRKHAHLTLIRLEQGLAIHDRRDDTTRLFAVHGDRGQLRGIHDAHGNGVSLDYAGACVRGIQHSDGAHLELRTLGGANADRAIQVLRVDGNVVSPMATYTLHAGLLIDADITSKERISYEYDAWGRRTSWRDHDEKTWVRYSYDEQGRCIHARAAEGFYAVDLEYDDLARVAYAKDSRGAITSYQFDEHKRLACKTDPLGNSTSWTYSRYGEVVAITDPLGHTEHLHRDPGTGLLFEYTDREGHTTRYFYDDHERVNGVVDPLDQAWVYHRGEGGLIERVEAPDGSSFAYRHNERGQLTTIERSDGAERTLDYDERGRLIAQSDWAGHFHHYEYDVRDRVSSATDLGGRREQLFWDPRDLLVAIQHPDRSQIVLERDHAGLISAVTDENGHTARREYGAFEMLRSATDAEGRRYELRYDPDHLGLSELLAPDGRRYRFERDAAGRIVREIDYAGRVTRYGLDAAGNRLERVNAAGQVTHYGYDKNGRLTCIEADGETTEFEHDALGRLVRAKNDSCELKWEYDPLGRVVRAVQGGETLEYRYDKAGRCIERELLPGPWHELVHRTAYAHGDNGRLTELALDGGALGFERDVCGNPTSLRFGDDVSVEQRFDERGLLAQQELVVAQRPAGLHRRYSYDAAGNLIEVEDSNWGSTCYRLDRSDRILAATTPKNTGEAFAYNANGQLARHRMVGPNRDLDLFFETGPSGLPRRIGNTEYEFDTVGRLIRKTVSQDGWRSKTWTFAWDSRDRLFEARTPEGAIWRYAYDPLGRRVLKYNPGTRASVHYLWDGDVLLREIHLQAKGAEGMEQVARVAYWHHEPGTFRPLAREVDGQLHLIVTDGIGTPVELIDEQGTVSWRAHRSVWGRPAQRKPQKNDEGIPLGFPGQYLDEETGLLYNRFRYYDPESGAYIGPDPIGLAGGVQPWAYVPNPNGWMDPLGLAGCQQRSGAFNQAKQDAGIPRSQQPDKVNKTMMTDRNGKPVTDTDGSIIYTREYTYTRTDGSQIVIQDHSAGHTFGQGGAGDQGAHFNVRPIENTRTGSVPGTQNHYPFIK